mgnify:CR=1 FL=1
MTSVPLTLQPFGLLRVYPLSPSAFCVTGVNDAMLSTSNEALVRYCDVISSWFPVCAQEQIAMANDAKKENVLAYFNRRNEDEIVVNIKDLKDVEIVTEKCKEEF